MQKQYGIPRHSRREVLLFALDAPVHVTRGAMDTLCIKNGKSRSNQEAQGEGASGGHRNCCLLLSTDGSPRRNRTTSSCQAATPGVCPSKLQFFDRRDVANSGASSRDLAQAERLNSKHVATQAYLSELFDALPPFRCLAKGPYTLRKQSCDAEQHGAAAKLSMPDLQKTCAGQFASGG